MFEKLWKPYFDVWTKGMGDLLEKYFRSPSTLHGISNTLNTTFRGKKITDKALYTLLSTAGLPSYRDQKRLLHLVTRLGAQLEDLEEKVDQMSLPADLAQRQYEALDARLALLFQRVEEIAQAQQGIHHKIDQVSDATAQIEPPRDDHKLLTNQLEQLGSALDALLAAELKPLQQLSAPQVAEAVPAESPALLQVEESAPEAQSEAVVEVPEQVVAAAANTTANKKSTTKKKAATNSKKTTKKTARKTTKKK